MIAGSEAGEDQWASKNCACMGAWIITWGDLGDQFGEVTGSEKTTNIQAGAGEDPGRDSVGIQKCDDTQSASQVHWSRQEK